METGSVQKVLQERNDHGMCLLATITFPGSWNVKLTCSSTITTMNGFMNRWTT